MQRADRRELPAASVLCLLGFGGFKGELGFRLKGSIGGSIRGSIREGFGLGF